MTVPNDMLKQEAEFRYRWIRKQVERLEEMKREGRRFIDMPIDEVIKMYMETHVMHMHLDHYADIGLYAVRSTFVPNSPMVAAVMEGKDVKEK